MAIKPKAKVKSKANQYDSKILPPSGKQTPADFMPKSYDTRYKPVKGGGVNNFGPNSMRGVPLSKQIQDDIKSGKINKDGSWKGPLKTGGTVKKKAKSGGSFPDLNKDGKVTKADILKGRGVIAKKGAKVAKMAKCKYGCK
jgi:hypothetical protein